MTDSSPEPRTTPGAWLRRLFWIAFGLGLAGALTLAISVVVLLPQLPDTSGLAHYHPKQQLRVFTADGVEIGGFGSEKRIYLPIDQIPKLMRDSLLAVEDARFYEHSGIDPIGVLRAAVSDLTGGTTQGASTITQQVARTFFLTRERTLTRKLKEALLSLKLERELSKDQILELYMNQIYLGAHAYGFAEAAQTYFGRKLGELTPAECAMLAGLPQNPYYANPIKNFERAKARQLVVLGRMLSQQVITPAQYEAAKVEKLVIRKPDDVDVHAEYVAEMVRQQIVARYGEQAYTSGLRVTTTLRADEQEAAYQALRRTLINREVQQPWRGPEDHEELDPGWADTDPAVAQTLADNQDDDDLHVAVVTTASPRQVTVVLGTGEVLHIQGRGLRQALPGLWAKAPAALRITRGSVVRVIQQGKDWMITQWPEAEGALVALDPHDGEVRALVGGFDFRHNQFNHATQGWRQPGSSYKPFLYADAMENGVMPETLISDQPLTDVGDWNPQDAEPSSDVPLTLRQALAQSRNLVTIRLVQLLGPQAARDWTTRFGFDAERQPDNLTLALGAGATTPLQLAGAYAVVANGGLRVNPLLIKRITNASGGIEFEAPDQPAGEDDRVVPARNMFMVSSLLQDVTRVGTAAQAQAQLHRPDLYGKTGTTNDVVDAWFAGFQPNLVAVVWVGYDNPKSLGSHASGAALALPAWIDFMSAALKGVPVQQVQPPEGVVQVNGEWRYSEWANGGFIPSLGLDGQVIDRSLIPSPPLPPASDASGAASSPLPGAAPASAPSLLSAPTPMPKASVPLAPWMV